MKDVATRRPLGSIQPASSGVKSRDASRVLDDLLRAPVAQRREFLTTLGSREISQVFRASDQELGSAFGLWRDDVVGFIQQVLGETLWSRTWQIMDALPRQKRVVVPSCFGSSKTWGAARAALWMALTHPVGTSQVVTIAPLWRQVVRQMWPEIRSAHTRAGLPGVVDQAQLKLPDRDGMLHTVAYGVSAAPWNEAAVQGIHSRGGLLLVVDEGGGISRTIGRNLAGLLVGAGARMLVIGNPPTDDEGSWFENLCEGEASSKALVLPISAYDTPNLSGEAAPRCRSCPDEVPAHTLATHLVDREWVEEVIADHGEDSPYVQSKVYARFPKGGSNRVIPASWVELAREVEEPEGEEYVRLCDLGLPDEAEEWKVRRGAWVRLGVDVAADGGDELGIARCVGDLATIEHVSSGEANSNSVHVAGVILEQIRRAEALAQALGTTARVRVKIDGIGVGWGVAGLLQEWAAEGKHHAEIVVVNVSESTYREPESATMRPYRKRDEMWLAGRALLQPGGDGIPAALRLRISRRAAAQLSGPTRGTTSTGFTVVESKKSMKKRGLASPDQGESFLLSIYEPIIKSKRKQSKLLV